MNNKSIFGFAFGPIANAILSLITLPIVAWIFDPNDIGRLNILQITLSFILLLSVLGLDQSYVREFHEFKDKDKLLAQCFFPGLILLLSTGIIGFFFAGLITKSLFDYESTALYLIIFIASLFNYISRFLSLILRMQERGWVFSISQILPKAIQILLIFFLLTTDIKKEFIHLSILTSASIILTSIIYLLATKENWEASLKTNFSIKESKSLIIFGFPLIFSGLAFWGLSATSAFSLRTWASLEELAIYSMANSFAGAAIIFQSIFTVVWSPIVYKWVSQGVNMNIVDKVGQQALAVVSFIVALCGSLSWLCDWLLPAQYADVKYILLCMMMQPLLYTLSEVTSVGIAIKRKTIYSLWATLTALITNLCINYFLVSEYGAAGAATANAIAFTVFFIARTEISAHIWRPFSRLKIYIFVLILLISAISTAFAGFMQPIATHFSWFVLLFFFTISFRQQWQEIFNTLKIRKQYKK